MLFIRGARVLFLAGLLGILFSCQGSKLRQVQGTKYPPEKRFMKTRIEGATYFTSFIKGAPYVRKYIRKRPGASPELTAYFRFQDSLAQMLKIPEFEPGDLKLAFVGDLMWVMNGWDRYLDPDVLRLFEQHDVLLANLETPVDPSKRVSFPIPDYPSFNSPVEFLTSFYSPNQKRNTLTAVSFANNHAFDRGESGAAATLSVLDSLGIGHSGLIGYPGQKKAYHLIEQKGFRIGFYASCWGTNKGTGEYLPNTDQGEGIRVNVIPGLAPLDPDKIDLTIVEEVLEQMARDSVDFKIVSIHWGFEFEFYPDPVIMDTGRKIVSAGADLIIGSHPHVQQPNEICFVNGYRPDLAPFQLHSNDGIARKALIAYSLGNFTTPMYTQAHRTGQIQSIQLFRNPETGRTDWTVPEIHWVYNRSGRKEGNFRKVGLLPSEN